MSYFVKVLLFILLFSLAAGAQTYKEYSDYMDGFWAGNLTHKEFDEAVDVTRDMMGKESELSKEELGSVYTIFADLLSMAEEYTEATGYYLKAKEQLGDRDVNILNGLGNAYSFTKKYEQALEVFTKATELFPEMPIFLANKGTVSFNMGKDVEAVEAYKKAISLGYKSAYMYNNYGIILKSQEKYEESLECYTKALDDEPDLTQALYNRANVYEIVGKYAEARKDYERLLDVDPENEQEYMDYITQLLKLEDQNTASVEKLPDEEVRYETESSANSNSSKSSGGFFWKLLTGFVVIGALKFGTWLAKLGREER